MNGFVKRLKPRPTGSKCSIFGLWSFLDSKVSNASPGAPANRYDSLTHKILVRKIEPIRVLCLPQ